MPAPSIGARTPTIRSQSDTGPLLLGAGGVIAAVAGAFVYKSATTAGDDLDAALRDSIEKGGTPAMSYADARAQAATIAAEKDVGLVLITGGALATLGGVAWWLWRGPSDTSARAAGRSGMSLALAGGPMLRWSVRW